MTAHVLTGSKEEIARKVADLAGEVLEVIVFVEDSPRLPLSSGNSTLDLFNEMDRYAVEVQDVDYSRAAATF